MPSESRDEATRGGCARAVPLELASFAARTGERRRSPFRNTTNRHSGRRRAAKVTVPGAQHRSICFCHPLRSWKRSRSAPLPRGSTYDCDGPPGPAGLPCGPGPCRRRGHPAGVQRPCGLPGRRPLLARGHLAHGEIRRAAEGDAARTFVVAVTRETRTIRGVLSIAGLDGAVSRREVTGDSCDEVVSALAFITAHGVAANATDVGRVGKCSVNGCPGNGTTIADHLESPSRHRDR